MFTSTTFANPTFQKRIRQVLWLSKLESLKTGKRVVNYVQNRNGRNVLRIDVYDGKLTSVYASGHGSKDFTPMLQKILQ